MNDERRKIEGAFAAVVDADVASGGSWWPPAEMASLAFRRWSTFERRHEVKNPTLEDRARDIAKGLEAQFDPTGLHTPPGELLQLARLMIKAIDRLGD